jgi:hypothetical protein
MLDLMKELERGEARRRVLIERYDPACERIDTAVKAIWKLYRRGKWGCLSEYGLTRKEMEPIFEEFDAEFITTDHGLLYQEATVQHLLKFEKEKRGTQKILEAATKMIASYILAFQDERRDYYLERNAA